MMDQEIETHDDIFDETEVEYIADGTIKKVKVATINYAEEYDKRIRNLQIVALVLISLITFISPLRLFDSRTIFDITVIGFVIAAMAPSLFSVFTYRRGRKVGLFISMAIYGSWILVLSTFYWEVILLAGILVIYFEIITTLHKVRLMLFNVESIAEGGAYYHANIYLTRYFKYLLKFGGLILGSSLVLGVVGWYLFLVLQGDIVFSIFMIICLGILILFSRRTLTADVKKLIIEEKREKLEEDMAKSHSRYS
ncbi:MAG: hypothetical protein FK733_17215 [Asgard group archaeon]|nr:hypothetical protein [Asgard group archaeon]